MLARRKTVFVLFLTVVLWAGSSVADQLAPAGAPHGAVSTAHPLATEAGIAVLQDGGNAFDAAVTIAATLNVVEPMMSGMGGYGTILIYDAEKDQVRFLDSSGRIPMHLDSDAFREPTLHYMANRRGPKAVSTPGNVNAWEAMSQEYGNRAWENLFEWPIRIAEEGYTVSKRQEALIGQAFASLPNHAKQFYSIDGRPLKEGQLLIQRDLANSLRLVAKHGSRVFYEGELARKIDDEMKARGGFLSIDDLVADKAEWWSPIKIKYNGFEVFTAAPPSTAFPSLIRLGMMSRLKSKDLEHNSADYVHYFAEVTKHAYGC